MKHLLIPGLAATACLAGTLVTGQFSFAATAPAAIPATVTVLARNHAAVMPIVLAPDAGADEAAVAATLAEYLGKIAGAPFEVRRAEHPLTGKEIGIVVTLSSRLPDQPGLKQISAVENREDYRLLSRPDGITVAGNTALALRDAVWDLLYRMGYRQFFPGAEWEVVPHPATLQVAVDTYQHPAYYKRAIGYSCGSIPENRQAYLQWCERNRAVSGTSLISAHSYARLISQHPQEFAAHPEYYALVDGKRDLRPGSKLCISNPGLRQLAIDDALARFAADPSLDSVSLEPSDGTHWCECPECAKLGSITDRAVTLANAVAVAVERRYPGKFVGMYAYNEHSPPPNIAVNPRVVVSIATAFMRGGYSVEESLDGWKQKASVLGIREYYSVNTWDRDLPGKARAANTAYVRSTIPQFYARGVRFMTAQASDNFGPNGLGYYLATRYMWDPSETARQDQLIEDFLEKAFGPAKEPMRQWYRDIDGANKPLVSQDLLGRMYRQLEIARKLAPQSPYKERLDDLTLYTRYVELYFQYNNSDGVQHQTDLENLLRFAYRIRKTDMVHTLALWKDLPKRDSNVTLPENATWLVPEGKNPWKSSEPFTVEQLDNFIKSGITANPLLGFQTVSFSRDLVPATPLRLPARPQGNYEYTRGHVNLYFVKPEATSPISFTGTGGLIHANRGPAKLELFPAAQTEDASVDSPQVVGDKTPRPVPLHSDFPGLHRLELEDASAGTFLNWPEGQPVVIESSNENTPHISTRYNLYFYVPKGTRVVAGYAKGAGDLLDGSGNKVFQFQSDGYWQVPVPAGQDGCAWKFAETRGLRMLMTVPPYLARSPQELLVPREVLEADAPK